jgi:HK97 gp10 family phage protein
MIEIRIATDKFVEKSLKKAGSEIQKNVNKAIQRAASWVAADAVRGIQRGKHTGKTYKRRGVEHQASAPGEYPASDTGRLASSIRINRGLLEADIGSDLAYAKYLEPDNGDGGKMKPRPFLEPSYEKNKEQIDQIIDEAIKKAFEI